MPIQNSPKDKNEKQDLPNKWTFNGSSPIEKVQKTKQPEPLS
jgi:hypothetical protein